MIKKEDLIYLEKKLLNSFFFIIVLILGIYIVKANNISFIKYIISYDRKLETLYEINLLIFKYNSSIHYFDDSSH